MKYAVQFKAAGNQKLILHVGPCSADDAELSEPELSMNYSVHVYMFTPLFL